MRHKKMDDQSTVTGHHLFKIDDKLEKRLKALANTGIGFKVASEHAHVAPRTLVRAASRQGKIDWLCKLFPASSGSIRREINQEAKQMLQFRALSMPWRASEMQKAG